MSPSDPVALDAAPRLVSGPAASARRDRLLAIPALLTGMMSVQLGASLAKSLFPVFGPLGMVTLRVGLAALVLLLVLRLQGGRPLRSVRRSALGPAAAYGVSLAGMNMLFYASLQRLPLGVAVSVEFIGPLMLAVLGSRRPIDLAWVALAAGGLLLLLDPFGFRHQDAVSVPPVDPLGILLAGGAAVAWALYILMGRRLGRSVEGMSATALGMTAGALFALPFGLSAVGKAVSHPPLLLAAFGVAMLSSALPYPIEMAAMRRMSTRAFSVLMSLEPALAAVIGLVLLHEALPPVRALAIALVVVASLGSALADTPPPAQGEPRPE